MVIAYNHFDADISRQAKIKQRFEQKTLIDMFSKPIDDKTESPSKSLPNYEFKSLPKIYFGTHTHSQIKQIIQELKRTGIIPCRKICLNKKDLNPKWLL